VVVNVVVVLTFGSLLVVVVVVSLVVLVDFVLKRPACPRLVEAYLDPPVLVALPALHPCRASAVVVVLVVASHPLLVEVVEVV